MEHPTDIRMKSMARSLRQHIGVANELDLDFAAQLLAMAVMEITTKIHGISQHELHALCERVEQKSPSRRRQSLVSVMGVRGFERRPRARRGRM
jgi:hypothetical protein